MATFNGTEGNDSISGGADADGINGNGGNDFLAGNSGDDTIVGGAGNDTIYGDGGNDWVEGGTGNDLVSGSGGQDNIVFRESGTANADTVASYDANWDRIQLDVAGFSAIGATGRFSAGDVRFFAGAGATSGHDADDRIVYNTSTGQLFYDADGSGPGAAQLIATFQGLPNITATDINAFGTATPSPTPSPTPTPTPGSTINGTNGNDTLIGTSGPDTINGFDGDDSIVGAGGADSLVGGFGNDTLDGTSNGAMGGEAQEADTLDGSLGNDTYIVGANDVIGTDIGGIDTVRTLDTSWTLGTGLENLILGQSGRFDGSNGFGNELNNLIDASTLDHAGTLSGLGGNDTIFSAQNGGRLFGGDGNDTLNGRKAFLSGGLGQDSLVTDGTDTIVLDVAPGVANADGIDGGANFVQIDGNAYGNIGPSGQFAADDPRFYSALGTNAVAHDADDRVIYDTGTGNLWYDADGNGAGAAQLMAVFRGAPAFSAQFISVVNGQTPSPTPTPTPIPAGSIVGTSGNDNLQGTSGNDSIFGLGGNDTIFANGGNDWVQGGSGNDAVSGGGGQDIYAFAEYGSANADTVANFDTSWDAIRLDAAGFSNIGATGRFAGGDVRFFSGAGATSAHDADDRIVYNTSTGQLFYDADGAGGANAELIATFNGAPGLAATDLTVFGTATPSPTPSPTPTPSGSTINGTSGDDALVGTSGNDTINGFDGNDTIDGAAGADSMVGGNGDDLYFVDNPGDSVVEAQNGGIDEVRSTINYALPDWLNNLTLLGGAVSGTGNAIDNVITGNSLNNFISGGDGNDTLNGLDGADTLLGGNGNDSINGHSAFLGTEDPELIDGGAGNDTLQGSGTYRFSDAPGAANADWITAIHTGGTTGGDTLQLDGRVHLNSGPSGRLTVDDGRFYAAAGATGGHDADDRIVYDITSGNVYWDDDGSGVDPAQLIVKVVNGGVNLSPIQFEIINGSNGGSTINGTSGNDSLVGTAGNDTLNGFDGNDTLDGGAGADSMVGGNGDDVYFVDNAGDAIVEAQNAGIDSVESTISYALPDWVNNLFLLGTAANGIGNAIENTIVGNGQNNLLSGGDGNDSLHGQGGNDTLIGGLGNDLLSEVTNNGNDTFVFNVAPGAANADRVFDFQSGQDRIQIDGNAFTNIGASGAFSASDARFFAGSAAHDADDRIIYDGHTLWYDADGNGAGAQQQIATFDWDFPADPPTVPVAASDITVVNGTATPSPTPTPTPGTSLSGTTGNDTLIGTAGNDTIFGNSGNDWIEGRGGNDQLSGGSGQDSYVFREFGAGNADTLLNFDSNWDAMRLDSSAFGALGGPGHFSAGDARFFAGAGATGGHDADDRIVYNTSSGQLYYDADGAGGADAQLVATIQGAAPVAAPDIWVI